VINDKTLHLWTVWRQLVFSLSVVSLEGHWINNKLCHCYCDLFFYFLVLEPADEDESTLWIHFLPTFLSLGNWMHFSVLDPSPNSSLHFCCLRKPQNSTWITVPWNKGRGYAKCCSTLQMLTLVVTTFFIGLVPNGWKGKKALHDKVTRFSYRLFSRTFSLIATYHQTENKPKGGGICVANHTSVIDIVPLGCETSFALVSCLGFPGKYVYGSRDTKAFFLTFQIGQIHGGFLGFLQFLLGRATHHIFFERAEAKDRMAVARR